MDLPKSIVKEFAKQAVDKKPTVDKPTQLVGTVQVEDGQTFVYLDGSNGSKTPVSETVVYQSGDRVLVSIQNRKATIIGNYTDPSINQALDNVIVEYALSSSSVSFIAWPGEKGEWNTIAPEREDGSYMWQRTTKISTNPLVNPEISLTCIQGSDGKNGYTPYIGSNGNWWINGVDTGYSAEGDDGHSPYVDTTTNTWWEWNADIGGYHDTGIVPQGQGVFKSIVFKRFSSTPSPPTGGSYLSPVPSGWSDGIPSGTEKIWMSTRVFTSDGKSPQTSEWTTPQMASDTPDIDFEYSWIVTNPGNPTDNPDNWSNAATENSIWMAVRKKSIGTWSSWEISKIKGEDGADGYSPTVTTGTSSEGSTTVTVTNKDGSTTTVLVDGKARADIDNLEIGGRNYIVKTDSFSLTKNGITVDYDGNVYHVYGTNTKTDADYGFGYFVDRTNVFEPGVVYTVSTTTPLPSGLYLGINTRNLIGKEVRAASNSYFDGDGSKTSNTFTCIQDTNGDLRCFFGVKADCGTVDVTFKIKLEIGNKATDWTPAPEDVEAGIANAQTSATSYITDINENSGIKVGAKNNANNYVQVNSDGMSIYQDINNDDVRVASLGANGIVLGIDKNAQTIVTADGIKIANADGIVGVSVDSSGTSQVATKVVNVYANIRKGSSYTLTLDSSITSGTSLEFKVELDGFPEFGEWFTITVGTNKSGTFSGNVQFSYMYNATNKQIKITANQNDNVVLCFYRYDVTSDLPLVQLNGVLEFNGEQQKDIKIEQGTSGNWTYEKWSSGIVKMYYNGTYSSAFNNGNYFGAYRGTGQTLTYPFTLASVIYANVDHIAPNTGFCLLSTCDTTNLKFYPYNRTNQKVTQTGIKVIAEVVGTWKLGE